MSCTVVRSCLVALMLFAGRAHAQELGVLRPSIYDGAAAADTSLPEPMAPKPTRVSRWPTVLGVSALVVGGIATFSSWPLYAGRTAYRERMWSAVMPDVIDGFESRGAWSFWTGLLGGSLIALGEQLMLPDEPNVPTLAWIAGAVGLGISAVGIAYAVGGTHCEPQALVPGAHIVRDCLSATSDALFGPLLLTTALPLLWAPAVYGFRALFAGEPASLTLTPTGMQFRATF